MKRKIIITERQAATLKKLIKEISQKDIQNDTKYQERVNELFDEFKVPIKYSFYHDVREGTLRIQIVWHAGEPSIFVLLDDVLRINAFKEGTGQGLHINKAVTIDEDYYPLFIKLLKYIEHYVHYDHKYTEESIKELKQHVSSL